MKKYTIPVANELKDNFFFPIRNRKDIIKLLMNTIKYVNSDIQLIGGTDCYIYFVIDNMNRIFYRCKDKVFSIRSPFFITKEEMSLRFSSNKIDYVSSSISSEIISLINDECFDVAGYYELGEIIESSFADADIESIWPFIFELLTYEDGYLRFDYDPDNANGRLHPLNHLDVFYSNTSTFKLGTYHGPCVDYLFDLISQDSESKFLEKGARVKSGTLDRISVDILQVETSEANMWKNQVRSAAK